MKINDATWELLCESKAQKQELLNYAESKGVRVERSALTDENVAFCGDDYCIWSFPSPFFGTSQEEAITPEAFRLMCDAYAEKPLSPAS